jgi:hypothetical protein
MILYTCYAIRKGAGEPVGTRLDYSDDGTLTYTRPDGTTHPGMCKVEFAYMDSWIKQLDRNSYWRLGDPDMVMDIGL